MISAHILSNNTSVSSMIKSSENRQIDWSENLTVQMVTPPSMNISLCACIAQHM